MSDVDVFAEGTAVVAELEAIAAELELTGAPDEEETALHPPTDEESRSAQRGVQVATALAISRADYTAALGVAALSGSRLMQKVLPLRADARRAPI